MLKDFFLKLPPKTKNILIIILVLIGFAIIGSFLPDSENTNSQNVNSQNTANEILKSRVIDFSEPQNIFSDDYNYNVKIYSDEFGNEIYYYPAVRTLNCTIWNNVLIDKAKDQLTPLGIKFKYDTLHYKNVTVQRDGKYNREVTLIIRYELKDAIIA